MKELIKRVVASIVVTFVVVLCFEKIPREKRERYRDTKFSMIMEGI